MTTPRGIRNNNPGNIRWGDDWQGLVSESQRTDKSFCQFKTPEYGIRAMIIILRNYQRKYGLSTVSGIIKRWAPPNENNTQAYINSVAKATGVSPDQRIDTKDSRFMMKLLQAIIQHENGQQPYGFDVFERAVELAGL
ncbi:structural protein [Klebsiella pneumoniae]|uniref:structural protein n=1 Tax=Klebsiella pneumoniae TaxID=573 RepID=UPI00138D11C8|nr:structural protein [Klebsiella pneumoniae]QHU65938.1 structural protein [Klebsiella pneumoniae]QHU73199.1 structural protein [Klebsiella pneumoniae]HBR8944414.1 structural protein [Klebsiella pneumoniae]